MSSIVRSGRAHRFSASVSVVDEETVPAVAAEPGQGLEALMLF